MNQQIRALVIEIMEEKDINQGELAKEMGLDREAINRMLNGRTGKIPKNWQKLFKLLGIEIEAKRVMDNSEQHQVTHNPQLTGGE